MSDLILREWNSKAIRQREDGYLSATDMCQACGKRFDNWHRLDSTKEYLEALLNRRYSHLSDGNLIDIRQGGVSENQGTWVHRKVALRLAQWLSPEFAIQVDDWVEELLVNGSVKLSNDCLQLTLAENQKLIVENCQLIEATEQAQEQAEQSKLEAKKASIIAQKFIRYVFAANKFSLFFLDCLYPHLDVDLATGETHPVRQNRQNNVKMRKSINLAIDISIDFLRHNFTLIDDIWMFTCSRSTFTDEEDAQYLISKLLAHLEIREAEREHRKLAKQNNQH